MFRLPCAISHATSLQPLPGSGEATPEEIFVAVGSALYHWEKMEVELAHLFHALIEARSGAAFRAYGSIQGIEGRRRAIEAAASSFFRFRSDPLLAQVFALTNAYASAASYRNNIAHGVTALFAVTMEDGEKGNSSWYLTPPSYATRRWPLVRSPDNSVRSEEIGYIYRANEIKYCELRFDQLGAEAELLSEEISTSYAIS